MDRSTPNIDRRRIIDARESFENHLKSIQTSLQDLNFATDVYRALCNMQWKRSGTSDEIYSCTWRYAGGLIAKIRDKGENYMDFYCSGGEGTVTEVVEKLFNSWGWEKYPYEEDYGNK